MSKKHTYREGTNRDRFYSNVRKAVELLKLMDPQLCRDMTPCLVAMQEEYHNACAARDFYEREFDRLMGAVVREAAQREREANTKLVLNDGTGNNGNN